jgi:hypothetical protein
LGVEGGEVREVKEDSSIPLLYVEQLVVVLRLCLEEDNAKNRGSQD